MSSSKTLASQTTVHDTELFSMKLNIAKAISVNIGYIILITNFLSSAKKAVNLLQNKLLTYL